MPRYGKSRCRSYAFIKPWRDGQNRQPGPSQSNPIARFRRNESAREALTMAPSLRATRAKTRRRAPWRRAIIHPGPFFGNRHRRGWAVGPGGPQAWVRARAESLRRRLVAGTVTLGTVGLVETVRVQPSARPNGGCSRTAPPHTLSFQVSMELGRHPIMMANPGRIDHVIMMPFY